MVINNMPDSIQINGQTVTQSLATRGAFLYSARMKTSIFLVTFLLSFQLFADEGTTTTTQQAADAAKRQGETGQSNKDNAAQLNDVMNEIDSQGGGTTGGNTPPVEPPKERKGARCKPEGACDNKR